MLQDDPKNYLCLHEIVRAARYRLNQAPWDYITGGAETETTLWRNRYSLDSVAFRPRVLNDVEHPDASSTFLDRKIRLPVLMAPLGGLETMHPDGALGGAEGCKAFGVPFMQSSSSMPELEAVAAGSPGGFRIFQLYVRGDDAKVADWARRAEAHGYAAFCVTTDVQWYGRREKDITSRYAKPWHKGRTGLEYQARFAWDNLKRLRDATNLPLIIKGIATAEDAEKAALMGIDVIYASNHGGRQLDHGRGTIDLLKEVKAGAGHRAKIVADGAVLRGTDVLKAICHGADCVGIGRLMCYGLAAAGAAGVERVLELLEEEMRSAMALLGVTSLDQLDESYVTEAEPMRRGVFDSAFPLLDGLDQSYRWY